MRHFNLVASLLLAMTVVTVHAEEEFLGPEENARKAHELSNSDIIYDQQNLKALYFQNQQIIQLLTEIRDEISRMNSRQAKEEKP